MVTRICPPASASTRKGAFVVIKKGASVSEDEVRDFVRDNLARYKVPRDVLFLDELPPQPHRQGAQAGARRALRTEACA